MIYAVPIRMTYVDFGSGWNGRYLVLANMLMESEVNPFDAQEAKPCVLNPLKIAVYYHFELFS